MKKTLSFFLMALVMTFGMALFFDAGAVDASAATYGDLTYSVSNGEVTITDCSTSATTVTIPSSVNGYPVTSIGNYAFRGCTSLTSISIPSSVTSIGEYAFYNCTSIESVSIGNGVTSIGSSAFRGCVGLSNITVDANNATYHSNGDCLIETESKILIVGCKSSVIPDDGSVTSIGDYAFRGCTSLTSIIIPDSVMSIGNYAFEGCSILTSVSVGNGVISIGVGVFNSCDSLAFNIYNEGKYLGNADNPYLVLTDVTSEDITSFVVHNETKIIRPDAFSKCKSNLVNVSVPSDLINVHGAFYGCSNLDYNISNGGKYLGNTTNPYVVLMGTTSTTLTSFTIQPDTRIIGDNAFSNCTSLNGVTIPDGVKSIGSFAFSGCSSLLNVEINYGVVWMGINVFSGCSNLESIVIPDSVEKFDTVYSIVGIFSGCTNLQEITLPFVGDTRDNAMSFETLFWTAGKSVSNIPSSLKKITITGGTLSEDTFNYRTMPTDGSMTIILGDGITSIPDRLFYNVTCIKEVQISSSVTSIGKDVFSGCTSLESVSIPFTADGNTLGYYFGSDAYDGGVETKQYYAPGEYNTYYIPESLKSVTVTGGDIPYGAFDQCRGLTSITIADGAASIGSCAFRNCVGITEIDLPASVTEIGNKAFYGCTGLGSIELPEGVESVGEEAFYGCTGLETVSIPATLTSISNYAFCDCTSLTSIIIPEGVASIGEYAFYNCAALAEVTIPVSVTSIGTGAFRKCDGIETVIYGGLEPEWNALENRPECDNVIFNYGIPTYTPGDLDGNEGINDADAVYLLLHTFFADVYPVDQPCDFNGDGIVNDADAVYLLMYTFFPEDYPIN